MSQSCVIFDFGNVLIQWEPHLVLEELCKDQGDVYAHLEAIGFYEWNKEQDRGRSMAEGLAIARRDHGEHYAIFATYVAEIEGAHARTVPGMSDLLRQLQGRGTRLFGLSNASMEAFVAVKARVPEIADMEDVLVSAVEKLLKPDPAIYTRLTERNGLKPEDCVFIDDSPKNVAGAVAVGMDGILFESAEQLTKELTARGIIG